MKTLILTILAIPTIIKLIGIATLFLINIVGIVIEKIKERV